MNTAARVLIVWLLWPTLSQAEPLLTVAPSVERQQRTLFEAGYSALHHLIAGQAGIDTRLQFMPITQAQSMLARGEARYNWEVCAVLNAVPRYFTACPMPGSNGI